ncbi:MAG: flagellar hook-length control protein FliK [Clostridium sp.]|nr:flagellar hook-length control protein FliK [Clostridium sp.]MCM1209018.1 flagellar hook-length control protein FliK [Ruminococcus sp.]
MNISDRGTYLGGKQFNNVYSGEQGVKVSTEQSQNTNQVGQAPVSANSVIAKVDVGQMFRGQILDITNNMVSISMEGKSVLTARMLDSVSLNIGDNILFQIQENNGSSVLIKPQTESVEAMKDNAIFKVLDANGLMPTEKNYQIAEALMNKGMPVDKGHMQQMIQQSYKFPDASIDTLTSLNKLGLEVNETNISQYQDYMNNSHQLSADLGRLAADIADFSTTAFAELGQSGNVSDLLELNQAILGIISDSQDFSPETLQSIQVNPEAALVSEEIYEAGNFVPEEGMLNSIQNESDALGSVNADTLGTELARLAEHTGMNREDINNIFDKLNKMGFDKEALVKVAKESDSPVKLMNNLDAIISNNVEKIPDEAIKDFFASKEFHALVNEGTKRKLSLNPEEMENPKEIDELYGKIYDKTNRLMDIAQSGAGNSNNLSQSAKSVQERIDFMQNLNNMYVYAQIPVKTQSSEMNSDLFVYMNKKAMKDAKEEVSALLHLDMEHLGATDVHVSLHGSTVHTRFYVDDEISARIIDEHMTMLERAINENGLSLTNEVIAREPSLNTKPNMVVDEMLGSELEQSVKRYSFDVRM